MTHLLCRECGRSCNYRDGLDPDSPRQVTRIESNMCIACHDGSSRVIEYWFYETLSDTEAHHA
jgi:hypothetical protein